MCKHCENGTPFYDEYLNEADITFEYGYPCLEVESDGYWTSVEIRYCPMCGRDLKGGA